MKTVFSNQSEVAHRWANQTQEYARSGPMSFTGVYAYSYNTAIGRLHTVNGHTIAIMSDNYYSATTCKHKSAFARALAYDILWVKGSIDNVEEALLEYQEMYIDRLIHNATSAYDPDFYGALDAITDFNDLLTKLGFSHLDLVVDSGLFEIGKEYQKFRYARNKELNAVKDEQRRIRQEAEAQERLKSLEEQLPCWLQGGPRHPVLNHQKPDLIRVKDGRVETTGGASVSLQAAQVLLTALLADKKVKGMEVDGYTVIGFDRKQGTVKIGCHDISFEQAVSVLKQGAMR